MPAFLRSELPVRYQVRHHWIVLFRPTGKVLGVILLILVFGTIIDTNPMVWILIAVVVGIALLRWQTWRAEWIILTGKRIIRVQGVPETTTSEASLRVDRVHGARMVQTVPGKILGYATIELEAPGEHPEVRRLKKIDHPDEFYLALRRIIFNEPGDDPDEKAEEYVTSPLPKLDAEPERDRFGRRRY